MSTLLYGVYKTPVSPEENTVRNTATPVEPDAPPAEAPAPPEWNETETDPNPRLGMAPRQLASDWHPSEQYVPGWAATANPTESFAWINDRQDKVGTAAAREMRGEQGHGTYAYAVGIEPTIRDGGAFGADYFAVDERPVQETAGDVMSPAPGLDRDATTAISGAAMASSRDATASSQVYADWYAAAVGR